ncbi:MAG: F0F1 ATP synthase subunit A [Marinilabiliales bacterium]|nr:F0F1 ATP synthase subunit A [Marinilabiliales bacterium]
MKNIMPYLLTVFFFILINNLMGLIPFPPPFGANVTGNIAVTFVLWHFLHFMITQFSGNKTYWKHIFATPGVPFWLLPIMIPVETHRDNFKTICSDDPTLCKHYCRTYNCSEPRLPDLYFRITGSCPGFNILCDFYGLPRASCGFPSGICFHTSVSTVHQPGSGGRTSLIFIV